jgi:hypothetical protein
MFVVGLVCALYDLRYPVSQLARLTGLSTGVIASWVHGGPQSYRPTVLEKAARNITYATGYTRDHLRPRQRTPRRICGRVIREHPPCPPTPST